MRGSCSPEAPRCSLASETHTDWRINPLSLGTFLQMCATKREYEEYGPTSVHKKSMTRLDAPTCVSHRTINILTERGYSSRQLASGKSSEVEKKLRCIAVDFGTEMKSARESSD